MIEVRTLSGNSHSIYKQRVEELIEQAGGVKVHLSPSWILRTFRNTQSRLFGVFLEGKLTAIAVGTRIQHFTGNEFHIRDINVEEGGQIKDVLELLVAEIERRAEKYECDSVSFECQSPHIQQLLVGYGYKSQAPKFLKSLTKKNW